MKTLHFKIILILFFLPTLGYTQIKFPFKKKTEKKVNKEIDDSIDKELDKLFESDNKKDNENV